MSENDGRIPNEDIGHIMQLAATCYAASIDLEFNDVFAHAAWAWTEMKKDAEGRGIQVATSAEKMVLRFDEDGFYLEKGVVSPRGSRAADIAFKARLEALNQTQDPEG